MSSSPQLAFAYTVRRSAMRLSSGLVSVCYFLTLELRNPCAAVTLSRIQASLNLQHAFAIDGQYVDLATTTDPRMAVRSIHVEVASGKANDQYTGLNPQTGLYHPYTMVQLTAHSETCIQVSICFEPAEACLVETLAFVAGQFAAVACAPTCRTTVARVLQHETVAQAIGVQETTGAISIRNWMCTENPLSTAGTATFVIHVTNTGTAPLTDITVSFSFDTNYFLLLSATPTESSVVGGTVTWNNVEDVLLDGEPLQPCASIALCVVLDVVDDGGSPNETPGTTLTDTSASVDAVTDNLDETAVGAGPSVVGVNIDAPCLMFMADESPGSMMAVSVENAKQDESVTFTYRLLNMGTVPIENITLHNVWTPNYLTLVSSTPAHSSQPQSNQLVWSWATLQQHIGTARLAPNEHFTVVIDAMANPAAGIGTVTNALSVMGPTELISLETDSDTVYVTHPALAVSKTRTTASEAANGELVTFQTSVQNTGVVPSGAFTLVETYDATRLAFVSAVTALSSSHSSPTIAFSIPNLLPGETSAIMTTNFTATTTAGTALNTSSTSGIALITTPSSATESVTVQPAFNDDPTLFTMSVTKPYIEERTSYDQPYTVTIQNTGEGDATTAQLRVLFNEAHLDPVCSLSVLSSSPNSRYYTLPPITSGTTYEVPVFFFRNMVPIVGTNITFAVYHAISTPTTISLTQSQNVVAYAYG